MSPDPVPERVRITRSRTRASRPTPQVVASEIDRQTGLGQVYVTGLMRAQRRLSVFVLITGALILAGTGALFVVSTPARTATLGAIPLAWFILGLAIYLGAITVSRFYVRTAERIERQFVDLAEDPRP